MRAVIQRVTRARVTVDVPGNGAAEVGVAGQDEVAGRGEVGGQGPEHVDPAGEIVGSIGPGLVALVGVTHEDSREDAQTLARKIAELRIMRDDTSVVDSGAQVLVISQFTLYGSTRKGRRPSWSAAAPGPVAEPLVEAVADELRQRGVHVETGRFGAMMQVELVNDGPVTVLVETGTTTI